ncbi:hypothetical protein BMW23_0955 [Bodo saltans virus]|uniref:Transmembrane protein n=1 Tax=Bodo saltans virus TaxID=2024608 RepID=A0A2H4UVR5_9VIRU|nr:hypothetical protein QJ851_gp0937 [Bodo saltans virus]ATZ81000.1 hypothetical protein BMW23_0955 [Bodo saltans virus]
MSYLEALKKNIDKKIIFIPKNKSYNDLYNIPINKNKKKVKKYDNNNDCNYYCCKNQYAAVINEHIECLNYLIKKMVLMKNVKSLIMVGVMMVVIIAQ